MKAVVLMSTPHLNHREVEVGARSSSEEVRGLRLAGYSPPSRSRERAAVSVDVDPERRSHRSHETCLALEIVACRNSSLSSSIFPGARHPRSHPALRLA